jgi:two-component system, OmpR family, sensor histidine kinase PhoQ
VDTGSRFRAIQLKFRSVHSLSRRLIVSVAVPLVLFFGVTILVLDSSFRDVSARALRDLLDAQMIGLIAAAEPQADGVVAPTGRGLEARFETPGSGLYAQIRQEGSDNGWRSPSATGMFIDFGVPLEAGQTRYARSELPDGSEVAILSRGISFEEETGSSRGLTFSVATSLVPYEGQLWSFRQRLFGWFLGLTLLLLATLGIVLRGVLSPVRRLESEITAVEEGERDSLGEGYPRELTGVTANLNALLEGERKRVARYRDTLGNLAHSLKTPLAVMRSTLSAERAKGDVTPAGGVLDGEIDRMTTIIEHQLKRAAATGGALLGQAPVEVAPIAADLRGALLKVYANKDLSIELAVSTDAQFVGDRADLTEVLGNLLDNACKWCKSRVRLTGASDSHRGTRERLRIAVEDDGPGISDADRTRVFERGVRTDEHVPGHGLGLAMVRDTVDLYGGTLTISRSPLGGANITLHLPGR